MKTLMNATALALILGFSSATYAQQSTTPLPADEPQATSPAQTQDPATEAPAATDRDTTGTTTAPATGDTVQTEPAETDLDTTATIPPATAGVDVPRVGEFIVAQQEGLILADELIGQTVYNAEDESLGTINNLLLDENGNLIAALLGVGGFLGIGEKSVALDFAQIEHTMDADGNVRLHANLTREALEGAPEFQTAAVIERQQQNTLPPASTTPAPGAPADTAPMGSPAPAGEVPPAQPPAQ